MHEIEPGDVLPPQQEHGVALLLAEDRHQHVDHADFLAAARLHMEHGALQHALESERGLHLALIAVAQPRRIALDVRAQLGREPVRVAATTDQHFAHLGRIEQRQQELLDGEKLMPVGTRLAKRLVETEFEFTGQHVRGLRWVQASSSVHSSGCWCSREKWVTCATLVSAIS